MPEGVQGYPKWAGTLRSGPAFPVVIVEEIRRAWLGQWSRNAFYAPLFFAILGLTTTRAQTSLAGPDVEDFLLFLSFASYGGLGLALVIGGPALLDDSRKGALDLYLSRAVTRADYLAGKVLAVFLATFGATVAGGLAYWGLTFVLYDTRAAGWEWIPLGLLGFGAIWALLASSLTLGLAALFRSSAAATLAIGGAFFAFDILVSEILSGITRSETFQVLSPLANAKQIAAWLFKTDAPYSFPVWWSAIAVTVLVGIGVVLVAWKHPRLKGVE